MKKSKVALILCISSFLLTIGICIQIKTIKEATNTVGTVLYSNSGLRDEALFRQEQYKQTYRELEEAEEQLKNIRTIAVDNTNEDKSSENEIKEGSKLLGFTEVKGQGLVIKIDDNRNVNAEEVVNITDYLVHEGDLLQIVNELYNAGAEAISINGQRIVSTTSIFCDGNIIRVNGESIGVPITIQAIGYPERMYYALKRPLGYLELMEIEGVVVNVDKSEEVTIPKYEGVYSYEFIK